MQRFIVADGIMVREVFGNVLNKHVDNAIRARGQKKMARLHGAVLFAGDEDNFLQGACHDTPPVQIKVGMQISA